VGTYGGPITAFFLSPTYVSFMSRGDTAMVKQEGSAKAIFERLDADGGGTLDKAEVMPMLEEIGVPELGEPGAAGVERKEGDRVFLNVGVGEKAGLQEGQLAVVTKGPDDDDDYKVHLVVTRTL